MNAPQRARASRLPARVLALAAGTLIALVLLELGLRIAADSNAPLRRAEAGTAAAGERRILCFGDSNTYGIHLEAHESYPAQLQQLLDRAPSNPWRVVNLGFPGMNSAEVRADFARNLEQFRPEIAIVWIGINDTWSLARSELWELAEGEPEIAAPSALSDLRLVRFARILAQRASGADAASPLDSADVAQVGADGRLPFEATGLPPESTQQATLGSDVSKRIRLDLSRLAAISSARGVRLALCTYPYEIKVATDDVNPAIAAAAAASGAPLIDLARAMVPLYRHFGVDAMLFPDYHQRAIGNREVARVVADALRGAGWLEDRTEWRVPSRIDTEPHLRILARDLEAGRLRLELYGNPSASATFELRPLVRASGGGEPQPLPALAPAELALQPNGLPQPHTASLDAAGEARIALVLPTIEQGEQWAASARARFDGWCVRALAGTHPSNSLRIPRAQLGP